MVKGVPIAIRSAVISNRLQLLSGTDIPVTPVTKKYLTVKESFKKRLPGDKTPEPERNQNVLGWKRTVTSLPLRFQKLLTIAIAYGQKRDP